MLLNVRDLLTEAIADLELAIEEFPGLGTALDSLRAAQEDEQDEELWRTIEAACELFPSHVETDSKAKLVFSLLRRRILRAAELDRLDAEEISELQQAALGAGLGRLQQPAAAV